jgi:tetratricopeptide (TPR) repeat protein
MRVDDLHVASRTSAFAYRGATEDIREIGRKLEVETVLEGSVRKSGDRLRITAQLLKVADGYQLWSERYDRQLEDVFEIQDEIAQNITRALRVVMTDRLKRAAEKAPTDNFQAYEYYLRGLQFFHEWRRRSVEHARRMFERAIDVDPNYALAHAGVAMCCAYVYTYWDASAGNLEQARAASRRALELNPESAEAYTALGLTLANSKHYEEAAAAYEAAIRLEPKLFDAHYFYGRLRLQQGRHADAVESFREACRLQPEDYQAPFFLAQAHEGCGQAAEAAEVGREALAAVERHLELHPDDTRALNLGAAQAAHQGQRDKATDWCRRALISDPEDSGLLYNVACVYAILGEVEPAVECLEKAVHFGFGLGDWVRNDPDLRALHGHPRFEAILAGI